MSADVRFGPKADRSEPLSNDPPNFQSSDATDAISTPEVSAPEIANAIVNLGN